MREIIAKLTGQQARVALMAIADGMPIEDAINLAMGYCEQAQLLNKEIRQYRED